MLTVLPPASDNGLRIAAQSLSLAVQGENAFAFGAGVAAWTIDFHRSWSLRRRSSHHRLVLWSGGQPSRATQDKVDRGMGQPTDLIFGSVSNIRSLFGFGLD